MGQKESKTRSKMPSEDEASHTTTSSSSASGGASTNATLSSSSRSSDQHEKKHDKSHADGESKGDKKEKKRYCCDGFFQFLCFISLTHASLSLFSFFFCLFVVNFRLATVDLRRVRRKRPKRHAKQKPNMKRKF